MFVDIKEHQSIFQTHEPKWIKWYFYIFKFFW